MRRLLFFALDDRRFAVDAHDVVEVVRAVAITPLPGAPAVVEGVVDVRGAALPVFDLRRRFGLAARAVDVGDRLVIVKAGRRTVVVRCDNDVFLDDVHDDDIDGGSLGARADAIAGAVHLDGDVVFFCDLDAFLQDAEAAALDDALAVGAVGA